MIAHSALAQNCVCSSSTSDRFVEQLSMHACAVWMYVPHIWPLLPICQILPRLYGWLIPKPSGMRLYRIILHEKNIAQESNWIEGKQIHDTYLNHLATLNDGWQLLRNFPQHNVHDGKPGQELSTPPPPTPPPPPWSHFNARPTWELFSLWRQFGRLRGVGSRGQGGRGARGGSEY